MEQKQYNNEKEQSIGGIWVKESANGRFLSISIDTDKIPTGAEKLRFTAFANRYKTDSEADATKPDYRVFVAKTREQIGEKVGNKI